MAITEVLGHTPSEVVFALTAYLHHSLAQRASDGKSLIGLFGGKWGLYPTFLCDICPLLRHATMGRKKGTKGHDVGNTGG